MGGGIVHQIGRDLRPPSRSSRAPARGSRRDGARPAASRPSRRSARCPGPWRRPKARGRTSPAPDGCARHSPPSSMRCETADPESAQARPTLTLSSSIARPSSLVSQVEKRECGVRMLRVLQRDQTFDLDRHLARREPVDGRGDAASSQHGVRLVLTDPDHESLMGPSSHPGPLPRATGVWRYSDCSRDASVIS